MSIILLIILWIKQQPKTCIGILIVTKLIKDKILKFFNSWYQNKNIILLNKLNIWNFKYDIICYLLMLFNFKIII